jgi:hypothetical protein
VSIQKLDQNSLGCKPILNQTVPDEGPKVIPLILNFSGAVTEYDLDLLLQQEQTLISMIQTVFVDLSEASNDLQMTIGVGTVNQTIDAKAGSQGYYPVLCPNPPKINFSVETGGDIVKVFLINVPIAGVVWTVA